MRLRQRYGAAAARSDGRLPREGNVGALARCGRFGEYAAAAAARLGIEYSEGEVGRMHAVKDTVYGVSSQLQL